MSSAAVIAIVIAALVVLAAIALVTGARRGDVRRGAGSLSRETRRKDRSTPPAPIADAPAPTGKEIERAAVAERSTALEPAGSLAPAPWVPPDPETVGFTRRQFFNRSTVTLMSVGIGGFGLACIAFLWPKLGGGFGSKINAGKVEDLKGQIVDAKGAFYLAEARTWLVAYPATALPKASNVYKGSVLTGMEAGFVALYQKCVHLGCRVPFCDTSQWFECPCHGSQYNRVGEKKGGPAPRGLDRWATTIAGGNLIIDTNPSALSLGPPIGTNTTGQEAEGPHCITSAGGH
jgi:cytochrome b6-f complex iron-sulfur subunit